MKNINQITADKLDAMNLSEKARRVIDSTEIRIMAECFGQLNTAEEVEAFIEENYPEE